MKRVALMILAAGMTTAFALTLAAEDNAPLRIVKGGLLDEIRLFVEKPPAATRVVIKPFSATDADIVNGEKKEETKTMQAQAPGMLAERFVAKLKELGPFADVAQLTSGAAPAGTLVVEGKFTEMDPGSRAKRYFVGFGAGKSGVTAEGSIKSADGTLLATFSQRRVGVMGMAGGDSMGKLQSDTKDIAEDIAKFLSAWANGKNLK